MVSIAYALIMSVYMNYVNQQNMLEHMRAHNDGSKPDYIRLNGQGISCQQLIAGLMDMIILAMILAYAYYRAGGIQ